MSLQCVLSLAEVVKSPCRDQNYSILVQFHSNGTDSGIKCILSSFADDTQLSGAVDILVAPLLSCVLLCSEKTIL